MLTVGGLSSYRRGVPAGEADVDGALTAFMNTFYPRKTQKRVGGVQLPH